LSRKYFKALAAVPALEVLAHRIAWSPGFLLVVTLARGRWGAFAQLLRSRRTCLTLATTTVLIAVNWGVFIWAVANGRLVEASLGYFITPLMNVLLGYVFLRERLRPLQIVAVALVILGIVRMTISLGHLPVISIVLAVSFAFYGLLRKQLPVSGIQGLTAETLLLAPVALGWMLWRAHCGELVFGAGPLHLNVLLSCAGVITALPLIWFAEGAKRLRLATMGFLQYISPSFQLLLAVVAFGEPFTRRHGESFAAIWLALVLYTVDTLRSRRRGRPPLARA
jgi:chloramphenicol-sensitive protein RarD